jgi:hypothetical protein
MLQCPDRIAFTVHAASAGWAGIGIGKKMPHSHVYVGWHNSTGGYTLVSSFAARIGRPVPADPQDIQQIQPFVSPPAWANTSFAFTRPIVQPLDARDNLTLNSTYFFAMSDIPPPRDIDSIYAPFEVHQTTGRIGTVSLMQSQDYCRS